MTYNNFILNDNRYKLISDYVMEFGFKNLCDYEHRVSAKMLKTNEEDFLAKINTYVDRIISLYSTSEINIRRTGNVITSVNFSLDILKTLLTLNDIKHITIRKKDTTYLRLLPHHSRLLTEINRVKSNNNSIEYNQLEYNITNKINATSDVTEFVIPNISILNKILDIISIKVKGICSYTFQIGGHIIYTEDILVDGQHVETFSAHLDFLPINHIYYHKCSMIITNIKNDCDIIITYKERKLETITSEELNTIIKEYTENHINDQSSFIKNYQNTTHDFQVKEYNLSTKKIFLTDLEVLQLTPYVSDKHTNISVPSCSQKYELILRNGIYYEQNILCILTGLASVIFTE